MELNKLMQLKEWKATETLSSTPYKIQRVLRKGKHKFDKTTGNGQRRAPVEKEITFH